MYTRTNTTFYITQLVSCGMNLTFGIVLLVGPLRIVAAMDRLRYDAERDAYEPPPLDD